jgi:hypothetical protein
VVGDPQQHRSCAECVQIMPSDRRGSRLFKGGVGLEAGETLHGLNTQTNRAPLSIRSGSLLPQIDCAVLLFTRDPVATRNL